MPDYALSQQQLQIISALSNGATMTAAADQAGIHRNTIANWRRNQLHFQHALADAQYDKAMLFREKIEDLVDLAVKTLHGILADPNAPAGVRLKAALAVLQTASTPPEPKRQVMLHIENVVKQPETAVPSEEHGDFMTKGAQPVPPKTTTTPAAASPLPQQNAHKAAQPIRRPQQQTPQRQSIKIGRNESCPCGSNLKFKRCCIGKPLAAAA